MTISAQLTERGHVDADLAQRATHAIDARHPLVADGYDVLDHRSRDRAIPATGAPPGRYLSLEHGEDTVLIALERPITHIGRGLIADVRLEDSQVSRRHAIVAMRGDGARVLDDRSSNGTFVNGRPVTVAPLRDGDVVRVGRVTMRYVEIRPRRRHEPIRRIPMPVRRARRGGGPSSSEVRDEPRPRRRPTANAELGT